eukprot:6413950-Prymnesium_polylepis.1
MRRCRRSLLATAVGPRHLGDVDGYSKGSKLTTIRSSIITAAPKWHAAHIERFGPTAQNPHGDLEPEGMVRVYCAQLPTAVQVCPRHFTYGHQCRAERHFHY